LSVDELSSAADGAGSIEPSTPPLAAYPVGSAALAATALATTDAEVILSAGFVGGTHFIFVTTLVAFDCLSLTKPLIRAAEALIRPWVQEASVVNAAGTSAVGHCLVQAVDRGRLPNAEVHPKRAECATNERLERLAAGAGYELAENLFEVSGSHAAPPSLPLSFFQCTASSADHGTICSPAGSRPASPLAATFAPSP
jgi:hypothetical protein